jgi:chemotaxis protein CheD
MGDMLASNQTNATVSTYSLGSCIGVVVYDPTVKAGGILHAMLPDSSMNPEKASRKPFMFVDTGLPALFHAVYALGGLKERLRVRLAGGAHVVNSQQFFRIGERNVESALSILKRNHVRLAAQDTGGCDVRTLRLDLESGALTVDVAGKGQRSL